MSDESITRIQSNDALGRGSQGSPSAPLRPIRGSTAGTSPTGSLPYHQAQCLRPGSLQFQPQQYQHAMVRYMSICRDREGVRLADISEIEKGLEKDWRESRLVLPLPCNTINFHGFPRPCCHTAVEYEELYSAFCARVSRLQQESLSDAHERQQREQDTQPVAQRPLGKLMIQQQYERHQFIQRCKQVGGSYCQIVDMAEQTQPVPTEQYGRVRYNNDGCLCEACVSGVTQPLRIRDILVLYHLMFVHLLPPIQAVPQQPHLDPGCIGSLSEHLSYVHAHVCMIDPVVRTQYENWKDTQISLRYPWVKEEVQKCIQQSTILPSPVAKQISDYACPTVHSGAMYDVEDQRGRNIWYKMIIVRVVTADNPDLSHLTYLATKEEQTQLHRVRKRIRRDQRGCLETQDLEHDAYIKTQKEKVHELFRLPVLTDPSQGLEDDITRTYGPHKVEEPSKRHRYAAEGPQPDSTIPQQLVHYIGWQSRWDEYISSGSLRIAPRGTRVGLDASTGPDYSNSRAQPPPPPPTPRMRRPQTVEDEGFGIAPYFLY